jgi:hypothetical protein
MATTTATRRLTAILAADVVGYSRLMGADEEGTHERLKAHLVELVDPKVTLLRIIQEICIARIAQKRPFLRRRG